MKNILNIDYGIKKVLIIDDSELLHRMYDLIFFRVRNKGIRVLHSYQGQEGLSELKRNPDTDLIILDIHMPVMNGLEFLKHCRKEGIFQHIPVIVTGTQGKEEDTMNGLKAGAKAYLTKPFETANLYKVIDKLFDGAVYAQKDAMSVH
jgi:two-component system, chemotaxis family, chemotaxis protein CheY